MSTSRTTPDLVAGIIKVVDGVDVTPFIDSANVLVTERCANPPYAPSPAYTDERLELIERWLAAHFYTMRSGQPELEGIGPTRVRFEGKSGMFLEHSKYGQHAMVLDSNGGLAQLNNQSSKGKAKALWLGTRRGCYNTGRGF